MFSTKLLKKKKRIVYIVFDQKVTEFPFDYLTFFFPWYKTVYNRFFTNLSVTRFVKMGWKGKKS